jgi:opacity protein-like surface antigen
LLALTGTSAGAAAQLNSLPVFVSPKGGTGLTLAVDYGRGLNDASGQNTAWAARATIGLTALTVGAGIGTVNPQVSFSDRDAELQYMGNAALRIFGGPLVPVAVNIHAGLGFLQREVGTGVDRRVYNVPVGVAAALNVPTPGFSIEPWIAPRFQVTRHEQGGDSDHQTGFGLSAGVNVGFANGLGIHGAVDWTDLGAASLVSPGDIADVSPAVLGIGLQYGFRLPG